MYPLATMPVSPAFGGAYNQQWVSIVRTHAEEGSCALLDTGGRLNIKISWQCRGYSLYSERPRGAGFRSVNPAERWCENPARALARAGFSQHLEATATSRPPARDIRDTVNPPWGFDQSAMLTSYRVRDWKDKTVSRTSYIYNGITIPERYNETGPWPPE